MTLAAVLAIGFAAGTAAWLLRLPGGGMLGALVAAAVADAALSAPDEPNVVLRVAAQIVIGAALGSAMTTETVARMWRIALPGTASVALLIAAGLVAGWALGALTALDPGTALLAMAPGGSAEMTAVALGLGAAAPLVASAHVVRQAAVLIGLAALVRVVLGRRVAIGPEVAE